MKNYCKVALKLLLSCVCWVFILSISIHGRTGFSYANELLVQNVVVRAIDSQLDSFWNRVFRTGQVTVREWSKPTKGF